MQVPNPPDSSGKDIAEGKGGVLASAGTIFNYKFNDCMVIL